MKSHKTESQDGVSSHKIGRNSRGTGISNFSSQLSQNKVKVLEEANKTQIPISQTFNGDRSSNDDNEDDTASPTFVLTVEDLTNT